MRQHVPGQTMRTSGPELHAAGALPPAGSAARTTARTACIASSKNLGWTKAIWHIKTPSLLLECVPADLYPKAPLQSIVKL
jgi:hypothetical protein